MSSVDIKPFLQYLEKEKHIPRQEACDLIQEAIHSSVEKSIMAGHRVEVKADAAAGKLEAWLVYRVTDNVNDPKQQINTILAREIKSDAAEGEEIRKPIAVAELGRIAAKTTQQLLNQKLRKIEKDQVFAEYKDKVGDIVTGTVRRTERGNVVIELGTAEAVLTQRERCHGDEFRTGDRIRCLLKEIKDDPQRGRQLRAPPAPARGGGDRGRHRRGAQARPRPRLPHQGGGPLQGPEGRPRRRLRRRPRRPRPQHREGARR
jgi:N utilization substance protein A